MARSCRGAFLKSLFSSALRMASILSGASRCLRSAASSFFLCSFQPAILGRGGGNPGATLSSSSSRGIRARICLRDFSMSASIFCRPFVRDCASEANFFQSSLFMTGMYSARSWPGSNGPQPRAPFRKAFRPFWTRPVVSRRQTHASFLGIIHHLNFRECRGEPPLSLVGVYTF